MRAGLPRPKSLSSDVMSSRIKITNNYLNSFPSLDNKSFLQGKMIVSVLNILCVVWPGSMTTAGLDPREKSYEDLVKHLEKL